MPYSAKEKELMLKLARNSILTTFEDKPVKIPKDKFLDEKRGVFVTLTEHENLRGCIGFPEPHYPLGEAIAQAAKSAAFSDPRFDEVTKEEMKDIKLEISVLTLPQPIEADTPEDIMKQIKIGRDGLILEYAGQAGLLLPQVPVEWKWDVKEFLKQICYKAGVEEDAWMRGNLYKFQAEVFSE
ncbi:AmmeMemoRadiSam system protein A [Candidatus Woesearchaeota archaeon]|nr:AmmeMemoRadiSam system protein A [Candidatus Woesearchaeota archaeon]MBW3013704.1 AmmeMemoRadiSam system protein A [Candidatus Woesearchaeota archaeon]